MPRERQRPDNKSMSLLLGSRGEVTQCSQDRLPGGSSSIAKPEKTPPQARFGEGERRCLLLAASRSQTRMEPDWEPATMSSSGVLSRTLSTGDV